MAGSGDQVAALLFWGGQVIKNGYLGSVDYSEPPKTMCFLSGRGNRYEELVGKVHTAMNGDDGDTMFDLFGKYPTTLPGGKVLFVSIPLTDDQSLKWFLDVASLSQPVHVYVVAAPKRNDEPVDDLCQVNRNQQQLNTPTGALMDIYVRTMSGRIINLEIESSDTIEDSKHMIEDLEGIPVKDQVLLFGGRKLDNSLTLAGYNISHMSTLDLLLRQCGC
ncbi:unnamed protein product [Cuscuta epithymum]|nr:unnamed protein product [Cuscuta epithymum]